jgi:membrane protease YdiL (CAAX protease family)
VAQWVPFTGLTALVLVLLLALARLSQGTVGDSGRRGAGGDPGSTDDAALAVEESAETAADVGEGADDATGTGEDTGASVDTDTVTETTATARRDTGGTDDGARATDGADADGRLDAETAEPGTTGRAAVEAETPGGTAADTRATGERPTPDRRREPELTTSALLANVALTQGLFGAVVLAGAVFYAIPAEALGVTGDPWNTGPPAVGLGVVFGVALWLANDLGASLADAAGASYDEELRSMLAPDSRVGWVVLLCVVLPVIAGVEELLFRAAAIGVPSAGFGVSPWALAILSSAIFALGHGAQGRLGVAVTGTLGFVLAAGYVLSGSLLVVVVAHYLVNALEFLVHEWAGIDRLLA